MSLALIFQEYCPDVTRIANVRKEVSMNTALKRVIDELYTLCDPNGASVSGAAAGTSTEREQLKTEFIDFLSYLSSSDGTISESEAEFITEYFGSSFTPEELKTYVEKNGTYSTAFENKAPKTLERLVAQDNALFKQRLDLASSAGASYIDVFDCLGKEFLVCDGDADKQEIEDFSTYMDMLRKYKREHSSFSDKVKGFIDISDVHAGENIPKFDAEGNKEKTLQELLDELNELIGLESVKKDVNTLIHMQEIKRIRKERGLKEIPVSNHLVFYGNPGTGKTTVARLLAQIYHVMGILSKGQFVETDRSGLVAGYVGQTALKVQEVAHKALGGVLFIDEAYSLTRSDSGNDYGAEAVDTLLKFMEDHRDDFIVIVAGYPELMAEFIDSNPGLRSRFNKYINFEDYDDIELLEIFKLMCKHAGYIPTEEAIKHCAYIFEKKYQNRSKNFANAREIRNFFESAMMNQADRLFGKENLSNEELSTLELADVEGII